MTAFRRIMTVVALSLAAGCGATHPEQAEPGPLYRTYYKPGVSLNTQMCSCTTCDPGDCCGGANDDQAPTSCGDGYDFSKNGCGISVSSCESRCFQQVWRVKLGEACETKRPAACCTGG